MQMPQFLRMTEEGGELYLVPQRGDISTCTWIAAQSTRYFSVQGEVWRLGVSQQLAAHGALPLDFNCFLNDGYD